MANEEGHESMLEMTEMRMVGWMCGTFEREERWCRVERYRIGIGLA